MATCRCARVLPGRSGACQEQAARAVGSWFGRHDGGRASMRARSGTMMTTWMRGRTRRRTLLSRRRRRRRRRGGRRGCPYRCDDVRDRLRSLLFDAGGACRPGRRRARDGGRDQGGGRREFLRGQRLRVGDGGVRLWQRRAAAEGIRACCRRNGEDAARDHRDESADAHTAMIGASRVGRYRSLGGSASPRAGGFRRPFSATAVPVVRAGLPRRRPRRGCRPRASALRC